MYFENNINYINLFIITVCNMILIGYMSWKNINKFCFKAYHKYKIIIKNFTRLFK